MHQTFSRRRLFSLAGGFVAVSSGMRLARAFAADDQPSRGEELRGLVVGHPQAAEAGMAVLADGGNAVDAAVTAALVAGVTAVHSCGIGGYGGHMTIAWPDGRITSIDYNSTAPAGARADMFAVDEAGRAVGTANTYGWLASGVPGTLAGMELALARFGTWPLARSLEPAIRAANDGFLVSSGLAGNIERGADQLRGDAGLAKLLFANGQPLTAGMTMTNRDLGAMLEQLAEDGSVESFYKGAIAEQIAAAFAAHGGLVTADDLAKYEAKQVKPLAMSWNGKIIFTAPLTAGGLTVLQAVAALRALEWEAWDDADGRATHARVEALRVAWNDRLTLLGDPDFVDVPIERLLSDDYAATTAKRIRRAVDQGQALEGASDERTAGGTIHLSAVDGDGMMVALTLTHGEGLGARVAVDGLGLILGHGMSRFDPRPSQANSIAPGKRPLNNMCPTIIFEKSRPIVALGGTGGRRIPNTIFDVLVNLVGRKRSLADAAEAPRMHTEGDLNLTLRGTWPEADVERLKTAGYSVAPGPAATLQAVES